MLAREAPAAARTGARCRWRTTDTIPDERLELIFACCHPALAREAQVALTLRALGGLTTEEIAARVPGRARDDEAPAARARRRRSAAPGFPFAVPADELLPERLAAVLAVVYLIFNAGYDGRVGDLAGGGDPARARPARADARRAGGRAACSR